MPPPPHSADLVRVIGRWSLVALAVNSILGSGIFGLPSTVAGYLGSASPLAVLLAGGLELIKRVMALDQRWLGLAAVAINILIGFEADTLRRWAMGRRGWRTLGAVTGKNADECERRFFEAWLPSQPIITPSTSSGAASGGLFGGWRRGFGALRGARP
jgi:hypothetical protein